MNIVKPAIAAAAGALAASLAFALPATGSAELAVECDTFEHPSEMLCVDGHTGEVIGRGSTFPCEEDEVLAYGPEDADRPYCENHEEYVIRVVTEELGG